MNALVSITNQYKLEKYKPQLIAKTAFFSTCQSARYCSTEGAGIYGTDTGRQLLAYADLTVTADVSGAFAPTGIAEGVVYADPPIGEPNRY